VYCAKEDRQSLFVETDYDSGGWQLAWIGLVLCLTTVN